MGRRPGSNPHPGSIVRYAVVKGLLPNLTKTVVPCVDCGKRARHYDHRDYLKPLDVEPVCVSCNRLRGPAANHDALPYIILRVEPKVYRKAQKVAKITGTTVPQAIEDAIRLYITKSSEAA